MAGLRGHSPNTDLMRYVDLLAYLSSRNLSKVPNGGPRSSSSDLAGQGPKSRACPTTLSMRPCMATCIPS